MFVIAVVDSPDCQVFRSEICLEATYLGRESFLCLAALCAWLVWSGWLSEVTGWVWEAACSASFLNSNLTIK